MTYTWIPFLLSVTSVADIDDVASHKRAEQGDIGCLDSIVGIFKY